MVPTFIISLVMLRKRKDFQPLKSRSVLLLTISTMGNFLFFTTLMLSKILDNNIWEIWTYLEPRPCPVPDDYVRIKDQNYELFVMIQSSCIMSYIQNWFARPVFFVPYYFRALRLYQIWNFSELFANKNSEVGPNAENKFSTYFIH